MSKGGEKEKESEVGCYAYFQHEQQQYFTKNLEQWRRGRNHTPFIAPSLIFTKFVIDFVVQ
jgi:hypothetical protein